MTLNEVMKETVDAIREKTGKSEKIKPIDFATEIKGITSGGGDAPSGGEHMLYFDTSAANGGSQVMSTMCKIVDGGSVLILPTATVMAEMIIAGSDASAVLGSIKAVGVCDVAIYMGEGSSVEHITNDTWRNLALSEGWKEITEVEFYDLNA